jgi:hypothetical protein
MSPNDLRLSRLACALGALLVLAGTVHAGDASGRNGFSAGIELRPQASAAEIGLPIYPGAARRLDDDDDSNALAFSMWGGSHSFKIVVLKYASADPIDRVASFYRDALGRYGTVLDCSAPRLPPAPEPDKTALRCDDARPPANARSFKVGTPDHYRIAVFKTSGPWVNFDLVRIDTGE